MVQKAEINYLFNLIAIAYADNDISVNELAFIQKKAASMNIDVDILEQLIKDAPDMHLIVPTHIIDRMLYMDDCIEMTKCDGVIHQKELSLCRVICKKLGLPIEYLEEQLNLKEITIDSQ